MFLKVFIMISKNKLKYIKSLESKKKRTEEGVFLAEGNKLVADLYGHFPCKLLLCTEVWRAHFPMVAAEETIIVTEAEMERASLQKSPQQVLAVFEQPKGHFPADILAQELCIALDNVQDPGNLGTIIRIADWFGISHLFCSYGTADVFNPKTIQSTMGALARVQVHYVDLKSFIETQPEAPIYGTFLDGNDIYEETLSMNGLIIMGNEGRGISEEIAACVSHRLFIPSYPPNTPTSESLNVGMATSIVCAEFRRRMR